MPLEIEAPVTIGVARQIAENIRKEILSGRLQSNERLPTENELAEIYAVSRPTIREALKRLAAQNLVRSRRGPTGGNFVTRPHPAEVAETLSSATRLMVGMGDFDIDEIVTTRLEMEATCCRLAIKHRTEDHIASLREELAIQQNSATDDVQFCESDVRFHRIIVDAANNALLGLLMVPVIEALLPVSNLIVFRVRERQSVIAFHQGMLDGLENRDEARALAALESLVNYMRERYDVAASGVDRSR